MSDSPIADQLYEALRLTREYVGPDLLPALPGWAWFDAMTAYEDWQEAASDLVEQQVKGHKVFVFELAGWPWIEMVNDDRPLVRMTMQLLPDEARGIAAALVTAADATDEPLDGPSPAARQVPS